MKYKKGWLRLKVEKWKWLIYGCPHENETFLKDPYLRMTLDFFSYNFLDYYGWFTLKRWKAWQDNTTNNQELESLTKKGSGN